MCWQLRAHVLALLNLILFLFLFQWQRRRIAARQDLSKQKLWTSRHLPAGQHTPAARIRYRFGIFPPTSGPSYSEDPFLPAHIPAAVSLLGTALN